MRRGVLHMPRAGGLLAAYARGGVLPVAVWDFQKGVHLSPWSVTRPAPACVTESSGQIVALPADTPRLDSEDGTRALLAEPARTRINALPVAQGTGWITEGAAAPTTLALNALGQFPGMRVIGGGADWHRFGPPSFNVTAGQTCAFTCLYRLGTSGRRRVVFYCASPSVNMGLVGAPGATSTYAAGGTLTFLSETLLADGLTRRLVLRATFTQAATIRWGVGPDTVTSGQDITVLAMQAEGGADGTSLILHDPATGGVVRPADVLQLTAPAGVRTVVQIAADGTESVQSGQTIPAAWTPTLAHRRTRAILLYPTG